MTENNTTTNVDTSTNTQQPEKIKVDLFGAEIEVDKDTGKKLISARDTRNNAYKELESKNKELEQQLHKANENKINYENILKSKETEYKLQLEQTVQQSVSKYHEKLIKNEIVSTLASNKDFINTPEALQDATKLIISDNKFEIDNDGNLKAIGGKKLDEIVSEFVSTRDTYKKVKSPVGTGGAATRENVNTRQENRLSSGLGKLLKK